MLTRLEERNRIKAHQYWPNSGISNYGRYTVKMNRCRTKPDYDFRSLTISITDDDENIKERKVYFLQYTGWPDFGVPTEASSFIDFYTEIQKQEEKLHVKKSKKRATSLYHCSAGIGRVGTFLAFESVLQLLQDSTPAQISIKDIVNNLRKERPGMVQTQEQYMFIYQAVNEYLVKQNGAKARQRRRGKLGMAKKPMLNRPHSEGYNSHNLLLRGEQRLSRTLAEATS